MIPTFVIFLREGIEASMIVAILLSYLNQIGERRRFRDVFVGIAVAFGLILAGGVSAYFLIDHYNGSNVQAYFETTTYLIAAAVLTAMTFWMSRHARTMSSELRGRSDVALSKGSRFGVGVLAFQAVGREGLETMVFTLAIIFASSHQGPTPHGNLLLVGALAGLVVATAISVAIYRLGAKLNFKIFFRVMGVALMVFAAGLLADAVENLQQLGWLPFGRHVLWNTSGAITEGSNLGDVLHSLLGYADRPTVLQGLVWLAYLTVCVGLFVSVGKARPKRHTQRVA
ncbi:MAG: FTR1 family protein [Acidobacteriota bacterium]|nr:FTR1 family protein [Acidobacteriota bacterium]MDE3043215.1 FTR1 family protein [Acidobacteriota bacterium]MDE3106537.1 FTR1 family protein [Acidobacteriota bacterium]MDE3222625.1 FTR1 family protein [Acidobacteriota bacterium]